MLDQADRVGLYQKLNAEGAAILPGVLSAEFCASLIASYQNDTLYRSTIDMQRYNFGLGQYRYFTYPLPPLVNQLREWLYQQLYPLAREWSHRLGMDSAFPEEYSHYLKACHRNGQVKPTPLILRYGGGDYNCLHQDLYGQQVFPLQMIVMLSRPGEDFSGGEIVLTEQRPRMQSRPQVFQLKQGEGLILAVNQRPVTGKRGDYRVQMRHGVSRINNGERFTLGIILHDAQ